MACVLRVSPRIFPTLPLTQPRCTTFYSCVAKYQYYESLLASALVPLGLVVIIMVSAGLRAQFAVDAEVRRRMFALHVKAALMVFVLSLIQRRRGLSAICEVLRPCQHFAYEGSFLRADLSKRCGTATHLSFVLFGSAMLVVITCGVLAIFTLLLYKNRARISPPAKDELTEIRVREADRSLDSIQFLFKDYKCSCLYMETVEMLRRVVMVGGVKFCGGAGLIPILRGQFVVLAFSHTKNALYSPTSRLDRMVMNELNTTPPTPCQYQAPA